MTKRSGTHKVQRQRRREALVARQADPNHYPSQVWSGHGWLKQWVIRIGEPPHE